MTLEQITLLINVLLFAFAAFLSLREIIQAGDSAIEINGKFAYVSTTTFTIAVLSTIFTVLSILGFFWLMLSAVVFGLTTVFMLVVFGCWFHQFLQNWEKRERNYYAILTLSVFLLATLNAISMLLTIYK